MLNLQPERHSCIPHTALMGFFVDSLKLCAMRSLFTDIGNFVVFTARVLKEMGSPGFELSEFLRQCYKIGNKSLPLVAVTGFVMGTVLTIQSRPALLEFGAVSMLPGMVAISMIREIGPVITALICAGKIGSGIGAELGSMRVTEQIDAMEVSAVNPIRYLVVTRVLAATFVMPVLVLFADAAGLFGSWFGVNIQGDVTLVLFMSQAFGAVDFSDFIPSMIKSIVFGSVIGLIGSYKGFFAAKGTESVGKAATGAVVIASLLVIIVDLVVVQATDILL